MHAILVAIRGMLDGIREASAFQFIMLCAFPALIGGLLVRTGLKWRHIASLIARTPVVPIGSAVERIAAVEGTAEARGRPLTSSFTGASCVWFRTVVDELEGSSWKERREEVSRKPFLLRDASGVCEVRALGKNVTPTDRSLWSGNTLKPRNRQPDKVPGSVPLSDLHAKLGFEGKFRYLEERIYPGDHVYVLGQFFKTQFDDGNEDDVERQEFGDLALNEDPSERHGLDEPAEDEEESEPKVATALRITVPADKRQPLVVSGVGADGARRLHAMRSKGMFIFATFFAAILAFFGWAHFLR